MNEKKLNENSQEKKSPDKKKEQSYLLVLIVVALFIIGLWLANLFLLKNDANRGTFGDMFGVVNALFSGLALAGVIYAILLQRVELKLQRKELEKTREQIEGQKLQLEAQNKTMQLQQFENTYFQMVSLYNEIVDKVHNPYDRIKGKQAVSAFWNSLKQEASLAKTKAELGKTIRDFFLKENRHLIYHYIQHVLNTLHFIQKSNVKDKSFYIKIFRDQLDINELALIYNYFSYLEEAEEDNLVTFFLTVESEDRFKHFDLIPF